MRAAILSTVCATLLLGALPVAAHGWSSDQDEQNDDMVVNDCPIPPPPPAAAERIVYVVRAPHHRVHARISCAATHVSRHHRRAYADRGAPRHYHGMHYETAVRIGGAHYDQGDASWRRVYREEEWSSSERRERWREDSERPSATDRFGYLTWPGKTLPYPGPAVGGPDGPGPNGPGPIDATPPNLEPPAGPWYVHP